MKWQLINRKSHFHQTPERVSCQRSNQQLGDKLPGSTSLAGEFWSWRREGRARRGASPALPRHWRGEARVWTQQRHWRPYLNWRRTTSECLRRLESGTGAFTARNTTRSRHRCTTRPPTPTPTDRLNQLSAARPAHAHHVTVTQCRAPGARTGGL